MGPRLRRLGGDRGHPPQLLLLQLLLVLLTARCGRAQTPSNDPNGYYGPASFSPSMAIVIVVLISAFFFLGFFSIYVRQCSDRGDGDGASIRGGLAARSRRQQRGLDPAVLETFPTMVYSEVKEHKAGKGALECAVCLSEFEDDETLRLLPVCSHVFHPECIDTWLTSHVTCPVCRSNLTLLNADGDLKPSPSASAAAGDPSDRGAEEPAPQNREAEERRDAATPPPPPDGAVVIDVHAEEEEEVMELERIGSLRRAMRAKSSRRPPRFPRSHSTGHSLAATRPLPGQSVERYTLRLPDHVLREIIAAGKLKRSTSLIGFPAAGEESSRLGYRGAGEGSSRGGRSTRIGLPERRPSFFSRTFSAKFPSWATGRRGDGEGSMRGSVRKAEGEGSVTGKITAVRTPFDCIGGGAAAAKAEVASDGDESSVAALRV